jgi:hypothetical protein
VFITADPRHRVDALRRCVHALGAGKALVFMNWQQRLRDARHKLSARGMAAAELHGEMGKQARQSVLEGFSRGEFRALLVSDVAARGLDVPGKAPRAAPAWLSALRVKPRCIVLRRFCVPVRGPAPLLLGFPRLALGKLWPRIASAQPGLSPGTRQLSSAVNPSQPPLNPPQTPTARRGRGV